jgi:hypothetical protein
VRAQVYRSIDTANTFVGLAFPSEVLIILTVFWSTAVTLPPGFGALITLFAYIGLRLVTYGKPPLHLQHSLLLHVRRITHGGRFSPAARASSHAVFPHAPRRFRDLPRAGTSSPNDPRPLLDLTLSDPPPRRARP